MRAHSAPTTSPFQLPNERERVRATVKLGLDVPGEAVLVRHPEVVRCNFEVVGGELAVDARERFDVAGDRRSGSKVELLAHAGEALTAPPRDEAPPPRRL